MKRNTENTIIIISDGGTVHSRMGFELTGRVKGSKGRH